jgi:hypothetical protein
VFSLWSAPRLYTESHVAAEGVRGWGLLRELRVSIRAEQQSSEKRWSCDSE